MMHFRLDHYTRVATTDYYVLRYRKPWWPFHRTLKRLWVVQMYDHKAPKIITSPELFTWNAIWQYTNTLTEESFLADQKAHCESTKRELARKIGEFNEKRAALKARNIIMKGREW